MASLKKKLISGGLWAAAGSVIAALMSLAINVMLARMLAPEEMGAYFLILSLVSISAVIAQLGFLKTIVKLIGEAKGANEPGKIKGAIYSCFKVIIASVALMALLFFIGAGEWLAGEAVKSEAMGSVIGLITLLLIFRPLQNFIAECFRGLQVIHLATIFSALLSTVFTTLILALIMVLRGASDLAEVLEITIISAFIATLLATKFLWNKLEKIGELEPVSFNKLFHTSWPIWLSNMFSIMAAQSDIWMVGILLGAESAAIYGAATRLMLLITLPLSLANAVIPSHIAELSTRNEINKLEMVLQGSATLAAIPSTILILLFIIFGVPIMSIVYGDYYAEGATILAILGMGKIVNVLCGSCGLTLMMTGHQLVNLITMIATSTLSISGAIIFTPQYGVTAIACAYAISLALGNIFVTAYSKYKLGIRTYANVRLGLNPYAVVKMLK